MNDEINIGLSVDDFFKVSTMVGSIKNSLANSLYGINHLQVPTAIPSNRVRYGYCFFTRPQLNLQSDNIRNNRKFYSLLNKNSVSVGRWVRCMLDPRLAAGYKYGDFDIPKLTSPLVDNAQAFIPLLTNNCLNVSGWPDFSAPTFTSKPGLYNEGWGIIDGVLDNYESYDLSANFRNLRGDIIAYLFYIWMLYASNVFAGTLVPYPDMITENEIDYNTRIYRVALDNKKKYVDHIACIGAGFPISSPVGTFLDYSAETPKPFNEQGKEINIRFRAFGLCLYDEVVIHEFNETVQIFNPNMRDEVRENEMVKVRDEHKDLFNNKGYFRIDPRTHEFEVWVPKQLHRDITGEWLDQNSTSDPRAQDDYFQGD